MNKPTIGRIVIYNTTTSQREVMDKPSHASNDGATNNVQTRLPAIIVAVWSETCVNLQVILDGAAKSMWVTSANQGDAEGNWNWPVKD